MKYLIYVSIFLAAFISLAQDKKATTEEKPDSVTKTTSQEMQMTGYVYKVMGRKDPFWNPLRGAKETLRQRKVGIAGLAIGELSLEGIMFVNGKYTAIFRGPDSNRPWEIKIGDMVYDGEVINIDSNKVVFKQMLPLAMGGKKEKIVKKYINPEEEENK